MPFFELHGCGPRGASRKPVTYEAPDFDAAVARAAEERLIVDVSASRRVYPMRHIHTKTAGVTFANADGVSRQNRVSACVRGEALFLRHNPANQFSRNRSAIELYNVYGHQLGHIPDGTSVRLIQALGKGKTLRCFVSELTGGRGDAPTLGLNLVVVELDDPETPVAEIGAYLMSNEGLAVRWR